MHSLLALGHAAGCRALHSHLAFERAAEKLATMLDVMVCIVVVLDIAVANRRLRMHSSLL